GEAGSAHRDSFRGATPGCAQVTYAAGRHRLAQVMQTFCPPRASLAASRPWHARAAMHATDVRANRSSALGLQHRPGAVLRPALAAPELLQLGRMRLVQGNAVVVGQLFAGLDPAGRL